MLVELRDKSQITIPKEIITEVGLSIGDKLDIYARDGFIYLVPVVVYPKKYLTKLKEEIKEAKEIWKNSRFPAKFSQCQIQNTLSKSKVIKFLIGNFASVFLTHSFPSKEISG